VRRVYPLGRGKPGEKPQKARNGTRRARHWSRSARLSADPRAAWLVDPTGATRSTRSRKMGIGARCSTTSSQNPLENAAIAHAGPQGRLPPDAALVADPSTGTAPPPHAIRAAGAAGFSSVARGRIQSTLSCFDVPCRNVSLFAPRPLKNKARTHGRLSHLVVDNPAIYSLMRRQERRPKTSSGGAGRCSGLRLRGPVVAGRVPPSRRVRLLHPLQDRNAPAGCRQ
jgi:hypothetical protein